MRKQMAKVLGWSAGRIIRKYRPEIIAVTGSVGKSTTKQALLAVLSSRFSVIANAGNQNTEIGLPLVVLGLPKSDSRKLRSIWLGARGIGRAMFGIRHYPKMLVLELGADHPGDISSLCDVVPPSVGIVTAVGESHLEKFGSVEAIVAEKGRLIERLPANGLAVLCRDDERVMSMAKMSKAPVMTFGFDESADVCVLVDSVSYVLENEKAGTKFMIRAGGSSVPFFMPGVVGRHALYAAAAAVAVGLHKSMSLAEISSTFANFLPVPGRMRLLPGIKRSFLVDDTYNAAPRSTKAALELLREFKLAAPDDRRFAVLGDMLELGPISVEAHREIGKLAAECAEVVVLVGENMKDAFSAAREAGAGDDRLFHFDTVAEAGRFVQQIMKEGDLILVKGSQGMRMEKITKEILAVPTLAAELLCRQDGDWLKS